MAYGTINADLMTTSDGVSSSGLYGFKNRIYNGQMQIDQRNAGASVSNPNAYTLDRWAIETSLSTTTCQQVTDAPTGFVNSLKFTTTTGGSLVAGSYMDIRQIIEGCNVADLAYGTALAQAVTVSFWVKSSLTGTFSLNLRLETQNVGYITTYTINSANTWEQKTITIPGNTATAIYSNTNGVGITVYFLLAAGSTYQSSTLNTWGAVGTSGYGASTTASTGMFTTTGATFQITGVQLEKGSTATSFDYRPYGTELALCQRYYNMVANYTQNGSGVAPICPIVFPSATDIRGLYMFPVQMRATPSVSSASGSNYFRLYNGNNYYANSLVFDYGSTNGIGLNSGGGTSGATQGQMAVMFVNAAGSYLALSAEL